MSQDDKQEIARIKRDRAFGARMFAICLQSEVLLGYAPTQVFWNFLLPGYEPPANLRFEIAFDNTIPPSLAERVDRILIDWIRGNSETEESLADTVVERLDRVIQDVRRIGDHPPSDFDRGMYELLAETLENIRDNVLPKTSYKMAAIQYISRVRGVLLNGVPLPPGNCPLGRG